MPPPQPPVSQEQLAANRNNAAKSTGPRSPQGKARSAQNGRKHGLTASTLAVLQLEQLDKFTDPLADLLAVYQPAKSQELFAIERLALTQQAILRAARLESGLFTTCLNEALDHSGNPMIFMDAELSGNGDIDITRAQHRNHLLGEGFHRIIQQSNSWSLAIRYQAQAERHYRRAIEEFDRLKVLQPESPKTPHEAIFAPNPNKRKPLKPMTHEAISAPNPAAGGAGEQDGSHSPTRRINDSLPRRVSLLTCPATFSPPCGGCRNSGRGTTRSAAPSCWPLWVPDTLSRKPYTVETGLSTSPYKEINQC